MIPCCHSTAMNQEDRPLSPLVPRSSASAERSGESTDAIIEAHHLTKSFLLSDRRTLLARLAAHVRSEVEKPHRLVAVDDVSFTVKSGEVLCIVGRNGSGKSTLLRMIAGIYRPTAGSVVVRGRMVPLINLGTGMQHRMSVRDNIYIMCSLLRMERAAIDASFDSIIAFGELQSYVDMEVYRLSSGLQQRLGFSIAVHSDPEVLLLDEVLSAGDAEFQEKSRRKMQELIARSTAVILTTHNTKFIPKISRRMLWLDEGRVRLEGEPDAVMEAYLSAS
ncbi:MAG: ATP-binding cassette domain-containing protein [Candidatus Peribacteraceae bacterium]|nr:ATP-binding cassette domain-containing protein [Candidatus Peribacteraceae bacterium]